MLVYLYVNVIRMVFKSEPSSGSKKKNKKLAQKNLNQGGLVGWNLGSP